MEGIYYLLMINFFCQLVIIYILREILRVARGTSYFYMKHKGEIND